MKWIEKDEGLKQGDERKGPGGVLNGEEGMAGLFFFTSTSAIYRATSR